MINAHTKRLLFNKKNSVYWKSIPIEIYTLFIPAICILILFLTWNYLTDKINLFAVMGQFANLLTILGGHKLFVAFGVLWALIITSVLVQYLKKRNQRGQSALNALKSLLVINIATTTISFILGLSLILLMVLVREDRVMSSTVRLDGTEKLIFGSVPAVGFITRLSGSIVEQLILYSYWYLYLFFSAAVLITAFLNKWIFRTLLNAFFLSFLIALPIFLLFPATSPDSLYLAKIFNFVPQPLFTDDTLSTIYNSFIEAFHEIWISKTNSFFSVSSMPSLHVAWGLIATISVFKVHRKTGYLFILWFLLNSIGTFYSLQHYALDTVGGFLLGLCALHITNKLLLYEKTYYTGKNWYYVVDYLTDQKNKIQSMFHTFCSKF